MLYLQHMVASMVVHLSKRELIGRKFEVVTHRINGQLQNLA